MCSCQSSSHRAGFRHILDRNHRNGTLGDPVLLLRRFAFLENLILALVNASDSIDGNLAFSSLGCSETYSNYAVNMLSQCDQGSWFVRSQDNQELQNVRVGERPDNDDRATYRSSLFSSSDENAWSFKHDAGNAGLDAFIANEEEEILLREARYRALRGRTVNSDAGDWKSVVRDKMAGQTLSAGANDPPVKMTELKLSHDVLEEVSGRLTSHPHVDKRSDCRFGQPVIHYDDAFKGSKSESHTAQGKLWIFTEVVQLPTVSYPFLSKVATSILLAGGIFIVVKLFSTIGGLPQRHAVKRRILRSQWYGNPNMHVMGNMNIDMTRSEFPRHLKSGVDVHKNILHFSLNRALPSKPNLRRVSQWVGDTKVKRQSDGQSLDKDLKVKYSKELAASRFARKKSSESPWTNEKALSVSENIGPAEHRSEGGTDSVERGGVTRVSWQKNRSAMLESSVRVNPKRSTSRETFRSGAMASKGSLWQEDDELDLDKRIKHLRHTVQSVELHRQAAMVALSEERQRSMELELKINRQTEAAAALEEEVRVLKESHDALLAALRKKYSSSAAARAAADLLYQDWESAHENCVSKSTSEVKPDHFSHQ